MTETSVAVTPKKKGRGSRPGCGAGNFSKYTSEFADQAYKFCLLGATESELANMFGVTKQTIYHWSNIHPEFRKALVAGRFEADSNVANSLYRRATGYQHDDVDIRVVSRSDGNSEIVKTPIIKKYPPDATSMIFWLKNRSKKWTDRTEHLHGGGLAVFDPVLVASAVKARASGEPLDFKPPTLIAETGEPEEPTE